MNKTLLLIAILLSGCATTETDRIEARAEELQERADALTELQDAEIDLAQAQGIPLTPAQQRREAERQGNKHWMQRTITEAYTRGVRANVNISNSAEVAK